MPRRRALRISGSLIHRSAWNKNSANFAFWGFSEVRLKGVLESGNSKPYSSKALIRFRRTAPPHLPLALDDDACPHIWMYLTVVRLLACTLEGVCVPLSWKQKSGVKRFSVVGRCGVQIEVHVDPSDLRPPLDGDVGRLEAEVLDQDRLGRMFFAMAVGCFLRPGHGHSEKRAHHNQRPHRHQQDDAPHKRNLLLLLLRPHSGAFVYKGSTQLDAWSDYSPECVEEEFSEVHLQDRA